MEYMMNWGLRTGSKSGGLRPMIVSCLGQWLCCGHKPTAHLEGSGAWFPRNVWKVWKFGLSENISEAFCTHTTTLWHSSVMFEKECSSEIKIMIAIGLAQKMLPECLRNAHNMRGLSPPVSKVGGFLWLLLWLHQTLWWLKFFNNTGFHLGGGEAPPQTSSFPPPPSKEKKIYI